MEIIRYILVALLFCKASLQIHAQDIQYSQYYANALYLSPAFAGAEENTRAFAGVRYQWPGLDASFISQTFSADHYIEKYKSGVGVIVNSDLSTAARIKSTEAGMMYAFQAEVSRKLVFRPALQISMVSRSIDFSRLTFGSQYNNEGFNGGATNETSNVRAISYADVSTGGIMYSEKFWVGVSAHHLNRPDQSFMRGESRLPMKTTFFGGYTFSFSPEWRKRLIDPDEEKSITPTFMYKMQGKSDQLDIGLYGRYNNFVAGTWYRGLPVKIYETERSNNDAIVILLGYINNGFRIGYSYDFTMSELTLRSGGSHELTASYEFKSKKKKKTQKRLLCPKF